VALVRVKEALGHASIRTTMRYAHLAPSTALDEGERALG
jgi:site-specific recombinase XerD